MGERSIARLRPGLDLVKKGVDKKRNKKRKVVSKKQKEAEAL